MGTPPIHQMEAQSNVDFEYKNDKSKLCGHAIFAAANAEPTPFAVVVIKIKRANLTILRK